MYVTVTPGIGWLPPCCEMKRYLATADAVDCAWILASLARNAVPKSL